MRIVVHGQQAFGKSVLEALLERGENVIAVYCAPDPKQGGRPDPLKEAALARHLPVYQPRSFRNKPEVWEEFAQLKADLCVMAYVTLFVPEEKVTDIDWSMNQTLQAILSGGITAPAAIHYFQGLRVPRSGGPLLDPTGHPLELHGEAPNVAAE